MPESNFEPTPEVKQQIVAVGERVRPYTERFTLNLVRVYFLIGEHFPPASHPGSDVAPEPPSDVLRAAVVFLHAALEDLLRTVAGEYLPNAGEAELNEVPLIGTKGLRPEKFYLGTLARHRGKTVDSLIRESVLSHLNRSTFNAVEDVRAVLRAIGLDDTRYVEQLPKMASLLSRRHQIVHRADLPEASLKPEPLSRDQVREWAGAVFTFGTTVLSRVLHRELTQEFGTTPASTPAVGDEHANSGS